MPEERNSQNANSDLPPKTTKDIIYKITRQEIAGLPRKDGSLRIIIFCSMDIIITIIWYHLKKKEMDWIGVPGLYFPGEQRAAGAFGFSQFMKPSDGELDLEEYEIEDEEHFGYWCRPVGAVIRKEVKEKEDAADIDRRRKIHEGSESVRRKKAWKIEEVPIGCVIVYQGKIIGRGYNRRTTDKNPLAHAEISAIKRQVR